MPPPATAPKPRVAHISSAHQRNDIRIFVKECSSLARAGYDVRLYVGDDKGEAVVNGVDIHDVGASAPGRFRRMIIKPWRIWSALRRNREKVVHFHDPELIPITLLLHWAGTSVVYDAHEDVPRQILSKPWLPNGTRRIIAGLFEAVENFAARRYTAVVTATPHIAARFARIGARTLDINNYPLPNELVAVPKPDQQAAPRTRSRSVCYIGGISAIRGVREIIAALPAANATLLLAGPFENAALEAELRAMPGWQNVQYKGVVSREGVRDILAEASIGLVLFHPMPNHIYALPNKMFEYMSAAYLSWRRTLPCGGTSSSARAQADARTPKIHPISRVSCAKCWTTLNHCGATRWPGATRSKPNSTGSARNASCSTCTRT